MIDVLYLSTPTNKYHITANDATIYKMIGESENRQQSARSAL